MACRSPENSGWQMARTKRTRLQRTLRRSKQLRLNRKARDMEITMTTLDGTEAGSVTLSDAIFGLEPRADILQRVVRWQLAKRRAGTHKTLGRSEINRTKKKIYKQKGTGGARHGAASAPQFRGGGRAFGPVVRSHG